MHLYVIRHGQSHVNLKEWNNGNLDVGLTERGVRQAAALAAWLPKQRPEIGALYASTMARAQETAAPLAQAYGVEIRADDRLREIGNNRLNHHAYPAEELPRDYSDYWASERPFATVTPEVTDGEAWMHFRTRVGAFVEEMVEQHEGEHVLAVCHGGIAEAVLDHLFNVGPWRRTEVWMHNTGILLLEYVAHPLRETWRLHFHNRVDHLSEVDGPRVAFN